MIIPNLLGSFLSPTFINQQWFTLLPCHKPWDLPPATTVAAAAGAAGGEGTAGTAGTAWEAGGFWPIPKIFVIKHPKSGWKTMNMSKQEQVFIVAYLIELLYIVGFEECQMQTFRNGHIPKWTKISEPLFFFWICLWTVQIHATHLQVTYLRQIQKQQLTNEQVYHTYKYIYICLAWLNIIIFIMCIYVCMYVGR